MFFYSLKQLLRRPGKALLFFLLLALATLMLVFCAVQVTQASQRIEAAEEQFTTIATVSQVLEPGDEMILPEELDFPGADYVHKPESRPYYLAHTSLHGLDENYFGGVSDHVVEFTALENYMGPEHPTEVRVEKSLYNDFDDTYSAIMLPPSLEKNLEPGDIIYINQVGHNDTVFETGKHYIAFLFYSYSDQEETSLPVYFSQIVPLTTQYNPDGTLVETDAPIAQHGDKYIEEVTEGFWEPGGKGDDWIAWCEQLAGWDTGWLEIVPTQSLELLPQFHNRNIYYFSGRAITEEEFAQGAKVCVMPQELAQRNALAVGSKIKATMYMSVRNWQPSIRFDHFDFFWGGFSPLDAQGKPYEPFFEEEYELVGTFKALPEAGTGLYSDAIVVPSASITASDENNIVYFGPMNAQSTSFQIPNGTISEFNTALHKAVPQAAGLEIIYNDNGYEEIIAGLNQARLISALLLAVTAFAALAILVLLLYFFVVKEKKRTAIERSLGMSVRQCRASLLSGIMVLALPAVVLGSALSWAAMHADFGIPADSAAEETAPSAVPEAGEMSFGSEDDAETIPLSREYSLWAVNDHSEADIELNEDAFLAQFLLCIAVPGVLLAALLILALLLIQRNLQTEPVTVLGGRDG